MSRCIDTCTRPSMVGPIAHIVSVIARKSLVVLDKTTWPAGLRGVNLGLIQPELVGLKPLTAANGILSFLRKAFLVTGASNRYTSERAFLQAPSRPGCRQVQRAWIHEYSWCALSCHYSEIQQWNQEYNGNALAFGY